MRPCAGDTISTRAPACSSAFRGSSNSLSSKPSVASTATRLPFRSLAMRPPVDWRAECSRQAKLPAKHPPGRARGVTPDPAHAQPAPPQVVVLDPLRLRRLDAQYASHEGE